MTRPLTKRELAYALLYQGRTVSQITEVLNVSREQVMTWICEESDEQRRDCRIPDAPSGYRHQQGRRKQRLSPEG